MNDATKYTIDIHNILDSGTVQLVRCTARVDNKVIDDFDVVYSREYDTAVVFPTAGLQHGLMETVENIGNRIGKEASRNAHGLAWDAAKAAVRVYLGLPEAKGSQAA